MDDSMRAYLERLALQNKVGSVLSGVNSAAAGGAAGVAAAAGGPVGMAASLPLGALSLGMGANAANQWGRARRLNDNAGMWDKTGLPERPLPETPEGDLARQKLLEALMNR